MKTVLLLCVNEITVIIVEFQCVQRCSLHGSESQKNFSHIHTVCSILHSLRC